MFKLTFSFFASLFLTACSPTITSVCPPIEVYSKEFNKELAAEIEALPDNSLIPRVVSDYISLRDQIKTCRR